MSRRLAFFLALSLSLSACVSTVITGLAEGTKAVVDERSFGGQVDDTTIYTAINRYFIQKENGDVLLNVTVNVRHARALLTGNVDKAQSAGLATELAWRAKGVQEVINEINVLPDTRFWNNANDALIQRNLETRLLITKGVWVVNYSIDVVNGTVYYLGAVDDDTELQRVLNVTRTTKGVKRVISYLKKKSEIPAFSGAVPTYNTTPANTPPAGQIPFGAPTPAIGQPR